MGCWAVRVGLQGLCKLWAGVSVRQARGLGAAGRAVQTAWGRMEVPRGRGGLGCPISPAPRPEPAWPPPTLPTSETPRSRPVCSKPRNVSRSAGAGNVAASRAGWGGCRGEAGMQSRGEVRLTGEGHVHSSQLSQMRWRGEGSGQGAQGAVAIPEGQVCLTRVGWTLGLSMEAPGAGVRDGLGGALGGT